VVGVGDGEMFLASSIAAFLRETRRVQFIDDGEVVELTPGGCDLPGEEGEIVRAEVTEIDWDDESAEKGGFETFMLKEIYEQPEAVRETIGDRVRGRQLILEDLGLTELEIQNLRRIVIVACGTAYHAGVVGRYIIEEWARVPVEPDIASEWIYRNPVLSKDTLVIGVSQSGETRDTVNAMKLARERGARTLAITNLMGTQITREAEAVLFTRCGLEIAWPPRRRSRRRWRCSRCSRSGSRRSARRCRSNEIEFILDRCTSCPTRCRVPRRRPPDRGDRAALLRQAVLPLPRRHIGCRSRSRAR
jgi:glucosamine--fructose-6-phosphate aminotransferase (isomerizing)